MFSKLKTIVSYFINLLLYLISFTINKNENIWIFGSWSGQRYADNSRYLFEYVNKYRPDIKAIWITKNNDILKQLKDDGKHVYLAYSIKAIWYSMHAKVLFVTQAISGDLHHFNNHPKILKVQLWHGAPLKKILHDSPFARKLTKYQKKRKFINYIFPFYEESYDLITACSEEDKKNFSTAFLFQKEKIKILGYPRNDILLTKSAVEKHTKVLYAPTLRRDNQNKVLDIFTLEDIQQIEKVLSYKQCKLYIKLHPYNTPQADLIKCIKKSENIVFLTSEVDLQEELQYFDILITDYSSIYFDFLLTDRPIIFAPFDYKNYLKEDRTFYYDYNSVTPGPKVKNWEEASEWIVKFISEPNLYIEERQSIKNKFHKFQDNASSERITNYIMEIL